MSERLDKMYCKDKGVRKRRRNDVGSYIGWANAKIEELLNTRPNDAKADELLDELYEAGFWLIDEKELSIEEQFSIWDKVKHYRACKQSSEGDEYEVQKRS